MKISTKGRYGVAAMYDLAVHYGEGPISLKSIAQRQKISENYLEQLVSTLRKAGYVKSIRGAQGGYTLSKDPARISVGDIIRIMEGPIVLVDCLLAESEDNDYCERAGICVTRGVWAKVCDSISSVLDSISLADLCREERLQGDVCDNGKNLF
ncbi:Rrf2 family transcriptional regulator [Pelosinus sp. UFO1]|uniref:RrF2 family transcriptional regulator n=1 Tax=Pelosinus sp. UFO1 TaxID=484770 RepID=UPI0004D125FF|nr:Rrf2 family transcriptional regulator [Pelosinus sp. UFO1]AIF51468.1 transcriptional regulator, BadM/Rrf2 family [Pelosinus sp. UFO1]